MKLVSILASWMRSPSPATASAPHPVVQLLSKGAALKTLSLTLVLVFAALNGSAQNAPPATDGWVVLPVDEYRALRRAAFPSMPNPRRRPLKRR